MKCKESTYYSLNLKKKYNDKKKYKTISLANEALPKTPTNPDTKRSIPNSTKNRTFQLTTFGNQ